MKKSSNKVPRQYHCKKCDYITSRNSQWERHLATAKHKMDNLDNKMDNMDNKMDNKNVPKRFICKCGKSYKYRSGLCKHQKKYYINGSCSNMNKKGGGRNTNKHINKQKFEQLQQHSSQQCQTSQFQQSSQHIHDYQINEHYPDNKITFEMLNKVVEQNKTLMEKIIEISKDNKTIHYQNCNNKKMTINVFLNEQCKNAMTLNNFIENVKVGIEDLIYTRDHGYVKGISNIFVKNLKDMNPQERPIHCSDKKRLQFYVKEENEWKKDENNVKIDKTIEDVTMKQIRQLKKWEQDHPNYLDNDRLLSEWHIMIQHIMGGSITSETAKNKEQIKKTLGNQIEIKDAMIK